MKRRARRQFADTVIPTLKDTDVILLANHGDHHRAAAT